jgi:hypothetical protein
MEIIITVPHAACFGVEEIRICDKVAERAADALKRELKPLKNVNGVTVFKNTMALRTTNVDMNRFPTRSSTFRKEIRETIMRFGRSKKPVILLDVHSFNKDSSYYFLQGDICILDNNQSSMTLFPVGYDWRLLHEKTKGLPGQSLRYLTSYAIGDALLNDIVNEARTLGLARSTILEFYEGLSDSQIINDAKAFVAVFAKHFALTD